MNPDAFREVKRNNGHRALVVDLQILVATFREKLAELNGKSLVTTEELDSATLLIDTLTEAIGLKEHSPQAREQTITIRAKAFTLVANAWEEVRHAVMYLRRRQGDADLIAPSLYSNRTSGGKPSAPPSDDNATTGVHPLPSEAAAAPQTTPSADLSASLAQSGPFKRSGNDA